MRLALALVFLAGAAGADAPESSLRPEPRPAQQADALPPNIVEPQSSLARRPVIRPADRTVAQAAPEGAGPLASPRPRPRAPSVERSAARIETARARGQVCGDPALQGERIAPIVGRIAGCGVAEPIRLRSVAGLSLSAAARMDCRTAQALKTWVEEGVKPAVGTRGGGAVSLRVAAGYNCRTRNNQPGARISEHGKGRAIDIAGIGLRSGEEITVLTDWGQGDRGRVLRQVWRAACGPFGTVLGPEADRFHLDHFHFDTARYRSGSFCR
ncbi:MAG: extensin family protein [Pseudomonadota bacterium]